jgi:chorismate mutase|tara:strand:+ start:3176 stop:3376 length:201 start_codon:yes stop_codon:yes gene_type:complete
MNDINEKYLTRMLDSAKQGLHQVDEAIDAINKQLSQMQEQREEMEDAVAEISGLLGITEKEETTEE